MSTQDQPVSDACKPSPPAFIPADGNGRSTVYLLGVCLVVSAMQAVIAFFHVFATADSQVSQTSTSDGLYATLAVVNLLAYLVCACLFCTWFSNAHRNLPALGATNLKYSPGWAVGGFFVPFLNLVRPYQVAREIWRHSNPSNDTSEVTPRPVALWWGLFLVMCFAAHASGRLSADPELRAGPAYAWGFAFLSDVLTICAAVAAIAMIRRINQMQAEKHRILQSQPARP
jgi:hypothetical protein